jgi:hypothetical protein
MVGARLTPRTICGTIDIYDLPARCAADVSFVKAIAQQLNPCTCMNVQFTVVPWKPSEKRYITDASTCSVRRNGERIMLFVARTVSDRGNELEGPIGGLCACAAAVRSGSGSGAAPSERSPKVSWLRGFDGAAYIGRCII